MNRARPFGRVTAKPEFSLVDATEALNVATGESGWHVRRSPTGSTDRTFVGRGGSGRLFVKFGVNARVLQRVGDLGVGPPVIAWGGAGARQFVVQPFINGRKVTGRWFRTHSATLGQLVTSYHSDAQLSESVEPLSRAALLEGLWRRIETGGVPETIASRAAHIAEQLRTQEPQLIDAPQVPTHGDPNRGNFILAGGRTYLIDWDALRLTDPLRDMGQILWWYVPRPDWLPFFDAFQQGSDERTQQSIHWWVAAESLDVALSIAARRPRSAEEFLADAAAASHGGENPRAWYRQTALPKLGAQARLTGDVPGLRDWLRD